MSKVAVIMSLYRSDCLSNIKIAIDSILDQLYDDTFLFLYRDGPMDNDFDDYAKIISQNTKVQFFTCEQNKGLAHALNFLIEKVISHGGFEFIARMDSDDISRENRIQEQVNFMSSNPDVDVCGSYCREFGASFSLDVKRLPITHEKLVDFTIYRCPFIHPTVIFRTTVFESGIRYPENTSLTEDQALWFDLLKEGFIFANIGQVLLDYRLNDNTLGRRSGFGKAISEVSIRASNMISLKRVSFKNSVLILSRIIFHLLPKGIMKLAYLKAR